MLSLRPQKKKKKKKKTVYLKKENTEFIAYK